MLNELDKNYMQILNYLKTMNLNIENSPEYIAYKKFLLDLKINSNFNKTNLDMNNFNFCDLPDKNNNEITKVEDVKEVLNMKEFEKEIETTEEDNSTDDISNNDNSTKEVDSNDELLNKSTGFDNNEENKEVDNTDELLEFDSSEILDEEAEEDNNTNTNEMPDSLAIFDNEDNAKEDNDGNEHSSVDFLNKTIEEEKNNDDNKKLENDVVLENDIKEDDNTKKDPDYSRILNSSNDKSKKIVSLKWGLVPLIFIVFLFIGFNGMIMGFLFPKKTQDNSLIQNDEFLDDEKNKSDISVNSIYDTNIADKFYKNSLLSSKKENDKLKENLDEEKPNKSNEQVEQADISIFPEKHQQTKTINKSQDDILESIAFDNAVKSTNQVNSDDLAYNYGKENFLNAIGSKTRVGVSIPLNSEENSKNNNTNNSIQNRFGTNNPYSAYTQPPPKKDNFEKDLEFINSKKTFSYGNMKKRSISPYEIKVGSLIPAILLSDIDSTLPTEIIGQVRENVRDTKTGKNILIPSGSKLIGTYRNELKKGQNRILISWYRVQFPDGDVLELENMSGIDSSGKAGFEDIVDNHFFDKFGNATLLSALGMVLGNDDKQEAKDKLDKTKETLGNDWNKLSQEILADKLAIPQTIFIRAGYKFNVMVNKDLVLEPYKFRY